MKCISIKDVGERDEKSFINKFLFLPQKLYDEKNITQNKKTEKELIKNNHFLSKYFEVIPYIVINKNNILGRCIITYYPDSNVSYIGFFECINNYNVCEKMLDRVCNDIKEKGINTIIGPVNASFWLGYRFRTTKGNLVFMGEPYNKDYYPEFFERYGFIVRDKFISGKIDNITDDIYNYKGEKRLKYFKDMGVTIRNINMNDYDKEIQEMYDLTMELFNDFPVFQKINKKDFCTLFSPLKNIVHPNIIQRAYYKNKLIGFVTILPNLYNLPSNPTLFNILKMLRLKKYSKEYVITYMGVSKDYPGLGLAMLERIKQKIKNKGIGVIAALIHEGKITGSYYDKYYDERYEYVLMEKSL